MKQGDYEHKPITNILKNGMKNNMKNNTKNIKASKISARAGVRQTGIVAWAALIALSGCGRRTSHTETFRHDPSLIPSQETVTELGPELVAATATGASGAQVSVTVRAESVE